VRFKAKDSAGNIETPGAGILFTYDVSKPTSTILIPVDNGWYSDLPTITGTASDVSGINKVEVAVGRNDMGTIEWWDDSVSTFTAVDPIYYQANEKTWQWDNGEADYPVFESGNEYLVKSIAYDLASNTETAKLDADANWFKFDNAPPVSTVTYPVGGENYSSITTISGSSTDDYVGLDKVELQIKELTVSNTYYWKDWDTPGFITNSTWVVISSTQVHKTSWTYTNSVAWTSGRRYELKCRAVDKSGNEETIPSAPDTAFGYDDTRPESGVIEPGEGVYYRSLTSITGTAQDSIPVGEEIASGIAGNFNGVKLQNKTDNNWEIGDSGNYSDVSGATAWSKDTSFIVFEDGDEYLVISRTWDKSESPLDENVFTVGVNSVTFVCDKSTPTSKINYPSDYLITNSLLTITGTVVDTLSGPKDTRIDIYDGTDYWDGNEFGAVSSSFVVTTSLVPSNTAWYYTGFDSELVSGTTYTVRSKGYDNAQPLPGNYETVYASAVFVYDITRPTSAIDNISSFMSSLETISGTAYDAFGIDEVYLLIRDLDYPTTYWQGGSNWSAVETWSTAVGKEDWTLDTSPGGPEIWTDGKQYQVWSKSKDTAGNLGYVGIPSLKAVTFRYDTTKPESRVEYPVDGEYYEAIATLSGTAMDPDPAVGAPSGVESARVLIKVLDGPDAGKFWTGAAWVVYNPAECDLATDLTDIVGELKRWEADGTQGWVLPSWDNTYRYQIQCKTYDNAGNPELEPLDAGSTWRCDKTKPGSRITLPDMPGTGEYSYNILATLSGTANDSYGIKEVQLRIFDDTANRTFDEIQAVAGIPAARPGWVDGDNEIWNVAEGSSTTGGTIDWTYFHSSMTWTNNRRYRISVRAKDLAGNYEVGFTSNTFKYDVKPPVAWVTVPGDNSIVKSLLTISGKSRDWESQTYLVKVQIKRDNNEYWNPLGGDPDGWDNSGEWNSASGSGSGEIDWTYDHPAFDPGSGDPMAPAFTSGSTYYVSMEARDNTIPPPSNLTTYISTVTFRYDNMEPVARLTLPVERGAYKSGTLGTISGTAYDATSGISKVSLHMLNLTTGATWYDAGEIWSAPGTWVDISTASTGGETIDWVYYKNFNWADGNWYLAKIRGEDKISNVETFISSATFIYDIKRPSSTVPSGEAWGAGQGGAIYEITTEGEGYVPLGQDNYFEDVRRIRGKAKDLTSAFNNSGIRANGVEICIIRDEDEDKIPDAGVPPNCDWVWDWVQSSWTAYSDGPAGPVGPEYWTVGTNPEGEDVTWVSPDISSTTWKSGKLYLVKSRTADRANNAQNINVSNWIDFYVTLPATLLEVEVPQGVNAGDKLSISVRAVDVNREIAKSYQGRVRFSVDGVMDAGTPEVPHTGTEDPSEQGWLPGDFQFTLGDKGEKTFSVGYDSETVRLVKAGLRTLWVTDIPGDGRGVDNITGSTTTLVIPIAPKRLCVVCPGQQRLPGVPDGGLDVDGPDPKVAGDDFIVTVEVCDDFWNMVPTTSTLVELSVPPLSYAVPQTQSRELKSDTGLPIGTTTFQVWVYRASPPGQYITVTDISGVTSWTPYTLPASIPVTAKIYEKLQVLVPGDTYEPGKPPYNDNTGGKLGTPETRIAGTQTTITVNVCDEFWNLRSDVSPIVGIRTGDKYDIEPDTKTVTGSETFNVTLITGATYYAGTLRTGATHYISGFTPSNSPVSLSTGTSGGVCVLPTTAEKLQVLIPSEIPEPGMADEPGSNAQGKYSSYGKIGTPDSFIAGTTFQATVHLVDKYYNLNSSMTIPVVKVFFEPQKYDIETEPSKSQLDLSSGTKVFDVCMLVETNQTGGPNTRNLRAEESLEGGDPPPEGYDTSEWSADIAIDAEAVATKLQMLFPGSIPANNEIPAPGTASGKTGTPSDRTAGVQFTVTVRACDSYWNLKKTENREVGITTTDPWDDESAYTGSLSNGVIWLYPTLRKARPQGNDLTPVQADITAYDAEAIPLLSSQTISNITVIPDTDPTKRRLQILLPGKIAEPGHTRGKINSPTPKKAGVQFSVNVFCVDSCWNRLGGLVGEPWIKLTTPDDIYANEVSSKAPIGTSPSKVVFQDVRQYTAKQQIIKVEDWDDGVGPVYASTQGVINVTPNTPYQIQVLVPDQDNVGGNWSGANENTRTPPWGKTAAITVDQVAGEPFEVTINACDYYWNMVSTDAIVRVATTDNYDVDPGTATLLDSTTVEVEMIAAGLQGVGAQIVTGGLFDAATQQVTIIGGTPQKIVIRLPGQTWDPGAPLGIKDMPDEQTAGVAFNAEVRVTDQYSNPTPFHSDTTVTLSSDDGEEYEVYPDGASKLIQDTVQEVLISVELRTATTTGWTITAVGSIFGSVVSDKVNVGPYLISDQKLLVLIPDETHEPGKTAPAASPPYGKDGSISATLKAGEEFKVTVLSCDKFWNKIEDDPQAVVDLDTTDSFGTNPGLQPLSQGEWEFDITLKTASPTVITANYSGGSAYTYADYATPEFTVNPATTTKLLVLLDGETHVPGKTTGTKPGKTEASSPATQTAGEFFSVTVLGCDDFWNKVPGAAAEVQLETDCPSMSTPTPQNLLSGEADFSNNVFLFAASPTGWKITAKDIDGVALSSYTSSSFVVAPNITDKILALLPGEVENPGASPGKAGSVITSTAGVSLVITAYSCDQWYNKTADSFDDVWIVTEDPYDIEPATQSLSFGVTTFVHTFVSATTFYNWAPPGGGWDIDIYSQTLSSYAAGTVPVNPNPELPPPGQRRLQVLVLDDETAKPGKPDISGSYSSDKGGREGSIAARTAGDQIHIRINACDLRWNRNVNFNPPNVTLTCDGLRDLSGDPNTIPNVSLTDGTTDRYIVMYTTCGAPGWSITATAPGFTQHVSTNIVVNPGNVSRLVAVMPGEIIDPFGPTGRTGSIDTLTAGTPFNVTVYAFLLLLRWSTEPLYLVLLS
jgi:hypothetical protein